MTIRRFAGLSLAASLIFVSTPVFASENPVAVARNASAAVNQAADANRAPSASGLAGSADGNIPMAPQSGSEKTQTLAITDGSGTLTQTGKDAALTASEAAAATASGTGTGNESEAQAGAESGTQADASASGAGNGYAARTSGARLASTGAGRANGLGASANGLGQSDGSAQPADSARPDGSGQPEGSAQTDGAEGLTESMPTAQQPSVQQTQTDSAQNEVARRPADSQQGGAPQPAQQPEQAQPQPAQSEPAQEAPQAEPVQKADSTEPPSGYLFVSEPLSVDEFAVAGLTWNKGQSLPNGATVEMRTLDAKGWSDWYVLSVEEGEDGRPGTEANVSGGSTGVQIRIKGSGSLPAGLAVNLVNGEGPTKNVAGVRKVAAARQPAAKSLTAPVANPDEKRSILSGKATGVASTSQFGGPAAAASPQGQASPEGKAGAAAKADVPAARQLTTSQIAAADNLARIHPRSAWGADERKMSWPRSYENFEGAIIHHTAGSNNYSQAQVPATIRGIYSYHSITRGWGDIGYNVLIDKYGGRWEGRSGTLAAPHGKVVTGAHAAPRNQGTFGVSVLGTYSSAASVTPLIRETFSDVIAARFVLGGVNPGSRGTMTVPRGTGAALPAGSALPRIVGHKDVKSTSCPGAIYGYLDQIRAATAAKYQRIMGGAAAAPQPQPAPQPSSPTYYLNNAWSGNATHTFTYGLSSDTEIVGDWDGDGKDTVSLRRGNTFAVNNVSAPTAAPKFTAAYGIPGDEYYVGDWDGDGKDSLAIRRGNVFHVSNKVGATTADYTIAYGKPGDVVLVGDWDGDGRDTFAVRRGNEYHIRNTMSSGPADRVVPYGRADDEVFVGHFGGSAKDALAVRRGKTFYVSRSLHNGDADRVIDYGRVGDRAFVGDWDGNRVDTFGVRRG